MGKIRRIWNVLFAFIMITGGILLIFLQDLGFEMIALGITIFLTFRGLKFIIYYFSMARHMVGGKTMLLIGVFLLDFGIFTSAVLDEPKMLVIIYLMAGHLFNGGVNAIKAVREKKEKTGTWKRDITESIVHLILAFLCIFFIGNTEVLVIIFSLGLFYSAVERIISSFRRTAIVYIQ